MEPSLAKPPVTAGSSYLSLKTVWFCSLLLILSVQFWMINETQRMASSQALLRVHLPSLRDSEARETEERELIPSTGAPLDEEDIPSAMDLVLKYRYNETCVKLESHHLEGLFIKPDLCISRRRMQQILTDLVLVTSAVFTEHNITHFLDSGTLLGSHRHKSVIPYDVDSDMGIDAAGYEIIRRTPIQFPPAYYLQVFGSNVHPQGTRYIELPVRVIHRESALYLDVFVYYDWIDRGIEWTGPPPAGSFINCVHCPRLEETRWEFKLPRNWVYPLKDCRFAKHTLKCPGETEKYLVHMFGDNYMVPVAYS
ncbi:hypothetical protein Gpo141_00005834 [Globisporangium polare]